MTACPKDVAVPVDAESKAETVSDQSAYVLPLFEERAEITKTQTISSRVTVSTSVQTHDQAVDELLAEEHAEIQRVPIGRYVTESQPVRHEDDTIIVPVVEEVLIVERRLLLKEEIRIRRKRTTRHHREVVSLRKQDAVIQRKPESATANIATEYPNIIPKETTDVQ